MGDQGRGIEACGPDQHPTAHRRVIARAVVHVLADHGSSPSVAVAQLVERQVVVLVVASSSLVGHPTMCSSNCSSISHMGT